MRIWRSSTVFCSVLSSALYLLLTPVSASAAQETQLEALQVGTGELMVEVADTPAERERGLMFRRKLPANRGMWFVFETEDEHCLWMKNTRIPLSAAFLDEDGRVINIVDMTPHTLTPHCATAPASYVLEVNQGWFLRHGVLPGTLVTPPGH